MSDKPLNKWQHKAEHWETQALCYWILAHLMTPDHPNIATFLWGYGAFTMASAFVACWLARD